MENPPLENNTVKKDLRKLIVVLLLSGLIFGTVQYLAVKTTIISDFSRNIYKATLENS